MDLGLVGRAAAAPDLRGRFLIAGLLRTVVGSLSRPLYPLTSCGSTLRQRSKEQHSCIGARMVTTGAYFQKHAGR